MITLRFERGAKMPEWLGDAAGWMVLSVFLSIPVAAATLGYWFHSRPLLTRGVTASAVCVNSGPVQHGTMLMLEYTPPGHPAQQYSVGPFTFPPVKVGERMQVVYDPRRPRHVTLPDRLPKETRLLLICGVLTTSWTLVVAAVMVAAIVTG